jgi:predicted AAA+ superfamily ATPase
VFREQNPWHYDAHVVPEVWAKTIERPLAGVLWHRLLNNEPRRFQLVLGPRRVGKTTSLYQTVRRLLKEGVVHNRIWWLRLDHPLLMEVPLNLMVKTIIKSVGATAENPVFLFLDELTYAKDWDLWLKTFYDETWPVVVAGSSSSSAALRHRTVESGVGRWEEEYLAPYLFGEYLSLIGQDIHFDAEDRTAKTIEALIDTKIDISKLQEHRRRFLLTGGFPELLIASSKDQSADEASLLLQSQRTLRNDAVERAIYKDIPQAFGVDNPMMLERTLYTLAGQFTGLLSPATICKNLDGLSEATFGRYLGYLIRSFLVFTLENYSGNEGAKQRRGKKLYFVDGAVRNAALQRGLAPLDDAPEMGLLMENLAAGHLHALSQQSGVRCYYWRDGISEVDLIYDHPEYPIVFEIASSATHHHHGIHALTDRYSKFKGRCYIVAPDAVPRKPADSSDNVGSLPLDMFLLAISKQAEKELAGRLSPITTAIPESPPAQKAIPAQDGDH